MLVEQDLFGKVRDKVQTAIDIARMFEPKDEPYILADSGGKDSACVKRVLDMAGVRYEAVYNVTTVDPPELVRHIISQYDGVIYDMPDGSHKYFVVANGKLQKADKEDMPDKVVHFTIPKYNMRQLIIQNRYPPTRLARYCCAELKEAMNPCRITVTGTRRYESVNRKQNSGEVIIFDGKQGRTAAEENNVNFIQTNRGGGGTELRRCSFKARGGTMLQNRKDHRKSDSGFHRRGCMGVHSQIQRAILQAV